HLVRSAMVTSTAKPKSFESLHEQWFFALRSPGRGELTGSDAELAALAEQVIEWRRPVDVSTTTPFRLCFRLEEPPPDREAESKRRRAKPVSSWYVRYLLQAVDDPSLLVPVAGIWSAKGQQAALLKRGD